MKHELRVIFGDTDQMGVVYYANYFRYFEAARAEFLRWIGSSGKHMNDLGVGFPVVEAQCRYRRPARYEDLLTVDIELTEVTGASLRFTYQLLRGDELLSDGMTRHACVDLSGKPKGIPAEMRTMLLSKLTANNST